MNTYMYTVAWSDGEVEDIPAWFALDILKTEHTHPAEALALVRLNGDAGYNVNAAECTLYYMGES